MNKFTFSTFQPENTDIAFAATNGYGSPTSELETRKQLSYPLKELKDYVNRTVVVDSKNDNANAVQLVIDNGELKYRTESLSTAELHKLNVPFSFVGMVVSGTNLNIEAKVKDLYGSDTNWTLISSVGIKTEHVFGNGKTLGVTNGENTRGIQFSTSSPNHLAIASAVYGVDAGETSGGSGSGSSTGNSQGIGVVTKELAGEHPEYSGLVLDTVTVYTWERTS